MNSTQRAHIVIPVDLLREIDALVGPRGRSAFLLEIAREEVRRRKLLRFLEDDEPAWPDRNHSEMGEDSAAWVRELRSESETRMAPEEVPARRRRTAERRSKTRQSNRRQGR